MQKLISVVIPAYNEEDMIGKTSDVIEDVLNREKLQYELLFVDDGSTDKTWEIITDIAQNNHHVRGIRFSKNFGKEAAIMAGLANVKGDCCVVIDCDLQHPPQKIIEMVRLWEAGYEVIEGRKSSRGNESAGHSFAAHAFYSIISKTTGFDMQNASDFKLLDRKAIDALKNMPEKNIFFRALSSWIGFKTATVQFDVGKREHGATKWSVTALAKYALRNISSFSTAPMQLITVLGILVFICSVIFSVIALVQKIMGIASPGFTTVIIILLFSSSTMMISMGIIGYYIARIYEEIQGRPQYIVVSTCGYDSSKNDDPGAP